MTAVESEDEEMQQNSSVENMEEVGLEEKQTTSPGDSVDGVKEVETSSKGKILKKVDPNDCFSLLLRGRHWFGFLVPLLQIVIYSVFILFAAEKNEVDELASKNNDNGYWHTHNGRAVGIQVGNEKLDYQLAQRPFWYPTDIVAGVKFARALAMIGYIIVPEAGIGDLIKTIYNRPSCGWRPMEWFVSIFRLFHSGLAIFTVAVLIITSEQSVDVFLNFAAMNFASDLDEKAFEFAQKGIFGKGLKEKADAIDKGKKTITLEEAEQEERKEIQAHWIGMALVGLFFSIIFILNATENEKNLLTPLEALCKKFYVCNHYKDFTGYSSKETDYAQVPGG